jgi:hypothetical protein
VPSNRNEIEAVDYYLSLAPSGRGVGAYPPKPLGKGGGAFERAPAKSLAIWKTTTSDGVHISISAFKSFMNLDIGLT